MHLPVFTTAIALCKRSNIFAAFIQLHFQNIIVQQTFSWKTCFPSPVASLTMVVFMSMRKRSKHFPRSAVG